MKFRKKPIVIEAVQWLGTSESMDAIRDFVPGTRVVDFTSNNVFISTPEEQMTASIGGWIIKGVEGELYPCKSDIFVVSCFKFEAVYEPA